MKWMRSFAWGRLGATLSELKRRHVFRVAVPYAAVSWVVLEVSSALFPPLGIPDWPLSLLAILLILGFPVAMVLAWAYDITPDGVQRTTSVSAAGQALPMAVRDPAGPVLPLPQMVGVSASSERSHVAIAALPFADGSPDGGYQFLGDGIADELINGLAQRSALRVVARTSSFSFRGGTTDVREIARRLAVDFVIEGSIRVTDERLRINARLVDAATGYAHWSGSYERSLSDVLALQEEIAQAVVRALPPLLDAVPYTGHMLESGTSDVEAWTLYLRGRELWNERTPAALRSGITLFEQTIARDPGFAHAHAGLADSFAILVDYGILAPGLALPLARSAADRAVQLAPDLAEAQTSRALVRQLDGDADGAADGFRHALTLNPAYSVARQRHALLLAWTGDYAEARSEIDVAREHDPLAPIIATSGAWIDYYASDYDDAVSRLRNVLDEHPSFTAARVPLALALIQLGRAAEAVTALEAHLAETERTAASVALHAHALARAGRREEAGARLASLRRLARRRYVSPYHLAVACTGLEMYEDALVLLRQAVDEHAPQLIPLSREPLFSPLHGLQQFDEMLRSPSTARTRPQLFLASTGS
jgi:adenylate cyclase